MDVDEAETEIEEAEIVESSDGEGVETEERVGA